MSGQPAGTHWLSGQEMVTGKLANALLLSGVCFVELVDVALALPAPCSLSFSLSSAPLFVSPVFRGSD